MGRRDRDRNRNNRNATTGGSGKPTPSPSWSRPVSRRWVVVSAALALVLALGGAVFRGWVSTKIRVDPTVFGPVRTLALSDFRVETSGSGVRLVGAGTTNLLDGARIAIELRTTEVVLSTVAVCKEGKIAVDETNSRLVTNGTYQVRAVFRLEEQTEAVRNALHYRPRSLEAASKLVVSLAADPARELRPALTALIQKANASKAPAELNQVAADAEALEGKIWFSTLVPAIRKLRRGLREALQAGGGKLDWTKLRRDLIEADFLASL